VLGAAYLRDGNERRSSVTTPGSTSTGIPDPDDPSRWLVRPWPIRASFCEVVHHFLMAYVWRLEDASTACQLAYFEGYRAALTAVLTDELTDPTTWHRHDELLGSIDACVTQYQDKQTAHGIAAKAAVRQLRPGAPAAIPTPFGHERAL
jgi:hypothetical protein